MQKFWKNINGSYAAEKQLNRSEKRWCKGITQTNKKQCRGAKKKSFLKAPSYQSYASWTANTSHESPPVMSATTPLPFSTSEENSGGCERQRKRIFPFVIPSCLYFYRRLAAVRIKSPPKEEQKALSKENRSYKKKSLLHRTVKKTD